MSYTKDHPYQAVIKKRLLLSKQGSTKSCFHLELSIDPQMVSYAIGDSIGVLPCNNPVIIEKILPHLSAKATDTIYSSRYKTHYPLSCFLETKANLSKVPFSFFKWLLEKASPSKKQDLTPLLEAENKARLTEFLQGREIWDLLPELGIEMLDATQFCDKLLPQLPRFYSIASSQLVYPGEIHLLIAEVSYISHDHPRQGVGSHFLCRLAKENHTPIPIYIQPSHGFSLPPDPNAPIIMIGPGTGIAPFRSFMQERKQTKAKGKNWIFFGERNRAFDFYYEDFWTELQKESLLRLSTAFSRDQKEKIYVQHELMKEGREIWQWLEKGAYLYLCGDASEMAKDVESTLQEIVKEHGRLPEEDAFLFLKKLKWEKRFLMDVY